MSRQVHIFTARDAHDDRQTLVRPFAFDLTAQLLFDHGGDHRPSKAVTRIDVAGWHAFFFPTKFEATESYGAHPTDI